MGLFGGTKKPTVPKLTQANFVRHGLYRKFRRVFAPGVRGEKKISAVDATLDIEHDPRHELPRLKTPLEEDEADERLERLARAGMISETEAQKVEEIIAQDLHPGQK